jgi:hypothetical protein
MTNPLTAQQYIDPEFINLACRLANCQPQDLMAVAWRDNELVVVVQPGPKHVFTAQQIFDAGWRDGQLLRSDARPQPEPKPAPTAAAVASLEHVANAHPGELAAAVHNAPPAPTYTDQYRKAADELTEAQRQEAKAKAQAQAEVKAEIEIEERDRQANAAPSRPFNAKRRP